MRFTKGYTSITTPLTDLLKKDRFIWSSKATEAFKELQAALCPALLLQLPYFLNQFVIKTDALGMNIGVVLL